MGAMEEDLYITDLIEIGTLQKMQDAFSKMTGIAALTTDANGVAVTRGSQFTDFCMKYTRRTEVGCARCEQCDKMGAELALNSGHSVVYPCHAGLKDFAAPIMAHGKMVGCFIGGQILTKEPDYDKVAQIAEEIGVDSKEYIKAIQNVYLVHTEEVDKAAEFLYTIAGVLSDIAYSRYLTLQANRDIEHAANLKSDFLANMSHEIRTPMNAVIGMAEMALREELTPTARDYINQIKSSGKALLTIINDILDFSKIDSGKMDITVVEYEPMSIVNDVANIIMTRIGEKDVELILDIAPEIPNLLLGDNIRIKQIIVNLANNAVKFTQTGRVLLKMDFEKRSKEQIELQVSIEDTGIGIKKEDVAKLFQAFQQVDSKRNRNIEGTGLGLAISKQLLQLMGGSIHVDSEYGKGSAFSFVLPQQIIDNSASITVKEETNAVIADLMTNPLVSEQLKKDSERLHAEYLFLESEEELAPLLEREEEVFLFIEQVNMTEAVEEFIKQNPKIIGVLLVGFNVTVEYPIPNLMIVKKPIYTLNLAMLLRHENLHLSSDNEEDDFDFVAPEAEVLIVDDNAINVTVAEGLLEPLKMQIDTAYSGKEAIGKISVHKYDVILMDHMMPELDGVETTHIIRRFHEEYQDTPIIALTANAVEGTREMFLKEGMNDFVAKPIELRVLVSKMKQWLPAEKIKKVSGNEVVKNVKENAVPEIGDLDVAYSMKLLGGEKLFWKVLKDYYRVIEKKADLLKELEQKEDWEDYTIEAHALKSASKQIGAMSLSAKAADMEQAGRDKDGKKIHACTDAMVQQYREYIPVLAPYCEEKAEESSTRKIITEEIRSDLFAKMRDALENLDMDCMEEVIEEMKQYRYQDWEQELLEALYNAVEEIDVDACEALLCQWEDHE